MLTVAAVVVSDQARRIAPGGEDNHIHILIIHGLYQPLHMHAMCKSHPRVHFSVLQREGERDGAQALMHIMGGKVWHTCQKLTKKMQSQDLSTRKANSTVWGSKGCSDLSLVPSGTLLGRGCCSSWCSRK